MNFLKKLFFRRANTLQAPDLQDKELCRVIKHKALSKDARLQVNAGQVAVLYHDTLRTQLYPTGEHLLALKEKSFLNVSSSANILYIKTSPPTKRDWALALNLSAQDTLSLQGSYTLKVDNAVLLTDNLLQPKYNHPDNHLVDNWVGTLMKEIMQSQHINQNDIEHHSQRLAQFLVDAMAPILADKGVSVCDIAFAQEPSAQATFESKPLFNPTTSDNTAETTTDSDETAPIAFSGPKIYYRVKNGQQIGPMSAEEIQHLIDQQTIKATDLIWQKGLRAWQTAGDFEHFNWPTS